MHYITILSGGFVEYSELNGHAFLKLISDVFPSSVVRETFIASIWM